MGSASLPPPSASDPLGCRLVGLASHCLDSRSPGGCGRHSLEPALAQRNRSCLPPTWTKEELGKRSSIERFGWLAFFSSFVCNVLLLLVGLPSLGRYDSIWGESIAIAVKANGGW